MSSPTNIPPGVKLTGGKRTRGKRTHYKRMRMRIKKTRKSRK